ncbi:hypothetical protein EV360DRAFT_76570 [Lentinula raphanica]|nr:hypothetical protein EV360DRAFT_76570 [Lentinula raphanica]
MIDNVFEDGLWLFFYRINFSSHPSDTVSNIGISGFAFLTIFLDPESPTKPVDRSTACMRTFLEKCDGLKSQRGCPHVPAIGPVCRADNKLEFSNPEPKSKPFAVGKVVEVVEAAGKVVDDQHDHDGWWKSLSAFKDHVVGSRKNERNKSSKQLFDEELDALFSSVCAGTITKKDMLFVATGPSFTSTTIFPCWSRKRKLDHPIICAPWTVTPDMHLNTSSVLYALVCSSAILHTACGRPVDTPHTAAAPPSSDLMPRSDSPKTLAIPPLQYEFICFEIFLKNAKPHTNKPVKGITNLLNNYVTSGLDFYMTSKLRFFLGPKFARTRFIVTSAIRPEDHDPEPEFLKDLAGGLQELKYSIRFSMSPSSDTTSLKPQSASPGFGLAAGNRMPSGRQGSTGPSETAAAAPPWAAGASTLEEFEGIATLFLKFDPEHPNKPLDRSTADMTISVCPPGSNGVGKHFLYGLTIGPVHKC